MTVGKLETGIETLGWCCVVEVFSVVVEDEDPVVPEVLTNVATGVLEPKIR